MKGAQNTASAERMGKAVTVLSGLVIIAIILMVVSFAYTAYHARYDAEYIERAEAVRVLSQTVAKNASEAANGRTDAFFMLRDARDELAEHYAVLTDGNPETGLPPTAEVSEEAGEQLEQVSRAWLRIDGHVATIMDRQDMVVTVNELADRFRVSVPELQRVAEDAATDLSEAGAPSAQGYYVGQLMLHSERIRRHTGDMLRGGVGNELADQRLDQSKDDLRLVLDSLLGDGELPVPAVTDDQVLASLQDVDERFGTLEQQVDEILAGASDLYLVRDAASEIFSDSRQIDAASNGLLDVYRDLPAARPLQEWYGFAFGGLALALLVARGFMTRVQARRELAASEEEKQRADEQSRKNQQAILDLLDEIQGLSEGDLTVQASVDEAFTGAIGDAFNDAIEALRSLVTTINDTSVQVSSAAQQTQATAMHLAEASDHQAHQITAASAAVNEMAVSIDQVSKNSEESADVAQRSVELATRGGETVRRTIDGMDSIREQIQETSKRIKRLGESSQEIGNIVELINDIADQTNILALNASIQAAMAGEAGRGFAVVADEVQRLAERSGNATKQIEALVKTIQTDTNEAVISMEQSTSGVVSGAHQAEEAGEALREIETTSQQLAGLIQNISEAAGQQAQAAANISDTMNVIQEITSQTSAGTNETATSIGNLADLANELRESVAGFKLPDNRG
ncbi:methyl-accepting chemotaxis protein [Aquisalimonas asiatica]|uniref:Twitching motility protein PilJ n=1 Tax=Aquisalimonas asiatica TaxID=406100 RepID=A0A1H8TQB1_9GAMM|nr:methyl-accepting chemotaxis protein [Aquisalimonas asiatica]SEO93051.1 twitching motility protein PilJ [Aquisalimonas asiatica]